MNNKLENEVRIVNRMIDIYCKGNHKNSESCKSCAMLKDYVYKRIENCPHKDHKPACNKCSIHCYNDKERALIRQVMRYSGPRMLYKNPLMVLQHMICRK